MDQYDRWMAEAIEHCGSEGAMDFTIGDVTGD